MPRIHVMAPEGNLGTPPRELAAAPATLAGLKIAVLDNGKPHADVLMQRIARQLADRSGAIFVGTRRKGSAATPCEPRLLGELAEEADLVLTGSAD